MQLCEPNSELQQVILRILQAMPREMYRTQLVKMVYFTDYIYTRHAGHTLTGLEYIWDQFGPNAVDNQIVVEADRLAHSGLIHMKQEPTISGDRAYLYHADPNVETPQLDPVAEMILRDMVEKYKSYSSKAIAEASKKTAPFERAHPGDLLGLGSPCLVSTETADIATFEELNKDEGISLGDIQATYRLA